jgi:chemotaxis family two-component system sensor kinase Cph1
VGGKLWGLIACHHYTPKFVPFEMRVACDLVGEVVSLVMATLESEEQTRYKTQTNVRQAAMLEAMASRENLGAALLDTTVDLLRYMPCGGCAVCAGDEVRVEGRTPTRDQILGLMRRMRRTISPIFATDDLRSAFAEAEAFKSEASGVISATISKERGIYVMWFRSEQRYNVTWSGDPSKRVYIDEKKQLHPRRSFDLWTEVVEGKSAQWTSLEIQAATDLRGTLSALMMRRGAES